MKIVRLSAICTGRLYLPANIPVTPFSKRMSLSQSHSAVGKIMSMKNPNEPATFRLKAQCLNQFRHRVSQTKKWVNI